VFPLALEAGAELAGLLAPAAGVDGELLAELAHAERARAKAASPAAPIIFRIRFLPFTVSLLGIGRRQAQRSRLRHRVSLVDTSGDARWFS